MKKPVKPIRPEVPEILKKMQDDPDWNEPKKFLEKELYVTPTALDLVIEEIKKDNPDISTNEICEKLDENHNWEVEFKDGKYVVEHYDDYNNNPNDYCGHAANGVGTTPINLEDFKNQVVNGLYVQAVASYKGDYIWGDPGVRIYTLVPNEDYDEQVKVHKEYINNLEEFRNKWYEWDLKNREFEEYKRRELEKLRSELDEE